ncbi:hypothetical protein BDW74DRAFT_188983 [Aspergillus multicolor]|uniref:uncharacterized protein n=1 Tax=Aspergillus multicolor TaxID=41759 RepID=UPI003CCD9935
MSESKSKRPAGSKIRFRMAPRPKQAFDFAPDQKWVTGRQKGRLTFVEMRPRVAATSRSSVATQAHGSATGLGPSTTTDSRLIVEEQPPVSVTRKYAEGDPGIASRYRYPPGPLRGLSETYSDSSYLNFQEACLLRHFIENLGPLFDTSDMDRHFTIVVPERSVLCPVLRYAIYTASAGHLIRLAHCPEGPGRTVSVDGLPLPNVTPETAIRYHDICISHLLQISKDPKEEFNEDVLAAATILRFYELIDAPVAGPSDAYLNAIQFIVNTQKNESFYAYQTIVAPPRDSSVHQTPSISLCHSACLAALRLEIWSTFLHQRSFRLPVSRSNDYNLCDLNNGFIHANRIFVWVADLLNLCFGGNASTAPQDKLQRWTMLKAVAQKLHEQRPPPLSPIYYRERDPATGRFFPEIWYTNACQVVAAQHVELGRILLAVSDPTRISRLGIGTISRNQALSDELQNFTRRVCGLALSNKRCASAMITAMVAIAVCGEYFTDPGEQDALLNLLRTLEYDYAWPTESTVAALRAAWAARRP